MKPFALTSALFACILPVLAETGEQVVFEGNLEENLRRLSDDDAKASPNLVVNSSFEYEEGGMPPYWNLVGNFAWDKSPWQDYERVYLRRLSLDPREKHSGRQSMRVELSPAVASCSIRPHQVGCDKGASGVFSVWMKASTNGLPVSLHYGVWRRVMVSNEWARYEVCCTNLPGRWVQSRAFINPALPKGAAAATLWIDDVQAETVPYPGPRGFDPEKSHATPYRPSALDAKVFGPKEAEATTSSDALAVPRLPAGVRPSASLDGWKQHAVEAGPFHNGGNEPLKRTLAYLACDADNLYIGYANYGEHVGDMNRPRGEPTDAKNIYLHDSVEVFFKMADAEGQYHLFAGSNGDRADLYANDYRWNGSWKTSSRAGDGCVEYLLEIPFSDLVERGFTPRWLVNLCRNDRSSNAHERGLYATISTLNWRDDKIWKPIDLPSDVAAPWVAKANALAEERMAKDRKPVVLGRLDYYMEEPEARFRIWDEAGALEEVALDIRKMPVGTNAVTLQAHGRDFPATVIKRPPRKGATQVNRFARCVVHDGEKRLFSGPCLIGDRIGIGRDGSSPKLDLVQASGFRDFHFTVWASSNSIAKGADILRAGEKRGLSAVLWTDYSKGDMPGMTVSQAVERLDFPNILSQMVIDEPELGKTSDWTRDFLRRMKATFPYHPVQMNNTYLGFPSRFADLETDILMIDNYLTSSSDATVAGVLSQLDLMRSLDPGKPCWIFLVCDNMTLHYKNPSYAEQTAQSWGAVCAGATGLSWYLGFPNTEGSWRAMVDANREIQSLAPAILSEELCGDATASEPPEKVRLLTRRSGGDWYLFSCNVDSRPLGKVSFALPENAPREGAVEVLFENRSLPLREGAFSDSYEPHSRHIYKLKGRTP